MHVLEAEQQAQRTDSASSRSDGGSSRQRDEDVAAPADGQGGTTAGPPTPLLDDLFREGSAWAEDRLPAVRTYLELH